MSNRFCKINFLIALCCCIARIASAQYSVQYKFIDSSAATPVSRFKNSFPSQRIAVDYLSTLPSQMAALGFLAASVDSLHYKPDAAFIRFYLGKKFSFTAVHPDESSLTILAANNTSLGRNPGPAEIQALTDRMLDVYENTGHPFATVTLDSVQWIDEMLQAVLKVNPGPIYKIDSLHVIGKARVSPEYLQRYLGIANNSSYNRQLLDQLDQRIGELPFLEQSQPYRLNMLPGGATVELFLEPKRSSQVYALLGLAPSSQQFEGGKLLISGEANLNLKNALGAGETIGINWQQLQYKSPKIILQFQYPYIFKSPFGIDFGFELFKKDSQWVNINARAGLIYELSPRQTGKVIVQSLQTNVSYVDTNTVRRAKQLPSILDVSSVNFGFDYAFSGTNYRLNPRKGWDISLQVTAGTKKIKRNNSISRLKDPANPSFDFSRLYDSLRENAFQFRIRHNVSYYLPLGRQTVLKTALQSGWYQSPDIFRNEMFQIGGYRLLRGFDEESIYANLFSVLTAEFRYLLAKNSYFFVFGDAGYTRYDQKSVKSTNSYLGSGLGLVFETGNSLINISLAAGKRNDLPFNLRQSKIHIGFVNFL